MNQSNSIFKHLGSTAILLLVLNVFGQNPCNATIPLTCGETGSFSLSGAGVWDNIGPWDTPGSESVFTFTPSETGVHYIEVSNNSFYVDLFFSSSFGSSSWNHIDDIYFSGKYPVFLMSGREYYFLIDDEDTWSGSGSLRIDCPCGVLASGYDASIAVDSVVEIYSNSTNNQCDNCDFRTAYDKTLRLDITHPGDYTLSLCDVTDFDTYMYLTDEPCSGNVLATNDDACGLKSMINYTLPVGTYYVTVEGYSFFDVGVFQLEILSTIDFSLPVELVDFSGVHENRKNYLSWTMASEIENDFFLIEKSISGIDFMPIGKIEGKGASNVMVNYSFIDMDVTSEVSYYRLRQVHYDGAVEVHPIIAVKSDELKFELTPNPATTSFSVSMLSFSKEAQLQIYNGLGQKVPCSVNVSNAIAEVTFDINPGVYTVLIEDAWKRKIERLVVE